MKHLFSLLFLLSFSVAYSQSDDLIRQEAYPEEVNEDLTPQQIMWKQVAEAKYAGNYELHKNLLQQYYSQFPEMKHSRPAGFNAPHAVDNSASAPFTPNSGDWGPGDIRIYLGQIYSGGTNTEAGGNTRTVRLKVDSLGNKYLAFIRSTRDTLYIFKSTNDGTTWSRLQRISVASPNVWHSFDFFITDTTNAFRLGFAASVAPSSGTTDGAVLYYMSMDENGAGFRASIIEPTPGGTGLISPSIVADGYSYPANITYWYVAFTVYSTSGANNPARAGYSPDGGGTWTTTVARSGFNDYDLVIDYNHFIADDSIYVLLSNNLTLANSNLRFRKESLANFTTAWGQFNPANSGDPEDHGTFVVNRQTNEMVCGFTRTVGGTRQVAYVYGTPGGTYFNPNAPNYISPQANTQDWLMLDCQESQGAYRLSYHSESGSYDSIIYKSTFTPAGGFSGHQIVNATNDASPSVSSSVAGFRSGAAFGGGVAFAGFGPTDVWYDASNIIPTGVLQNGTETPNAYNLSQNYPNPFNPSTTINFSIPISGMVKLIIFDLTGREIKTLVNENMEAGTYNFSFNGSDLGSGVYFYKLVSGTFFDTKKMILIK